jgi:hypothetical protein
MSHLRRYFIDGRTSQDTSLSEQAPKLWIDVGQKELLLRISSKHLFWDEIPYLSVATKTFELPSIPEGSNGSVLF